MRTRKRSKYIKLFSIKDKSLQQYHDIVWYNASEKTSALMTTLQNSNTLPLLRP